MPVRHRERHRTEHIGWLRAAVLGANDGILSTASSGARRCGGAWDSQRRVGRGGRRAGRGCYVDGCG